MSRSLEHRWIRVDGLRMHALAGGPRDSHRLPVVLIHGFILGSPVWAPVAERLASEFRVLAPDLPGFNLSETPRRALDVPAMTRVLEAWLDAEGIERAIVVGNSMGSQIGAHLAAENPTRVARLILQGPTVDPAARSIPAQLWRMWQNERRENDPALIALSKDQGKRVSLPRAMTIGNALIADRIETKLPHITAPTLVMRGQRDAVVSDRWAKRVRDMLRRGWLIELADATHSVVYVHPNEFVRTITPFLRGEPPY